MKKKNASDLKDTIIDKGSIDDFDNLNQKDSINSNASDKSQVATSNNLSNNSSSLSLDFNSYQDAKVIEFNDNVSNNVQSFSNIELDCSTVETYNEEVKSQQIVHRASITELKRTNKKHMNQKTKSAISNSIIYVILVVMCVIWIIPFVFIVFESFRCESTGLAGYVFPQKWGFDNYIRLFTQTDFPKWFLNTLIMGLVTSVVETIFILAVSYALSRNRFKGRKFLMNLMLILGMFPGFLTLILLYTLLNEGNMANANAPIGLVLIYVGSSGMGYYICKGFFDTISHSLDEAAKIDGATNFQIFYKIIIPLCKPIIIYTILMGFMAPWGDFVTAKFMANNDPNGFNVAVGLQWLVGVTRVDKYYTTFCAGGVVVALPITLLFMFLQKYYVAGVTGGAVKG